MVLLRWKVAEVDGSGLNVMKGILVLLMMMPVLQAQSASPPRPLPQSLADWPNMMPTVREALKAQFPDELLDVYPAQPTGILRASGVADVTGDGVSEAIVAFGVGGASTSQVTVMRIQDGNPVVALFKDRAGKITPMVWADGASVMHTDGVDLLPNEHAVFAIHYNYGSNGKLHQCGGEAYTWNPRSKTFGFNPALTKKLTRATCSLVPNKAG